MAESAFNWELLGDFSQPYDHMFFYNLIEEYHITNLAPPTEYDHPARETLAYQLYWDYKVKLCNALGYIRDGMNARLLWELRKSGVLRNFMGEENKYFFDNHLVTMNDQEIKKCRSKVLIQKFMDYEDHDWQYFWVLKRALTKEQQEDFEIVGEQLFADCDPLKSDDLGDPIRDFVWATAPIPIYTPIIRR